MGTTLSQPSNKSMVDELVEKHHYIMSPVVEGAFRAVDRAMYFNLEEGDTFDPYSETPWRDGNIHLSAPCIYARAVEALDLQPGHSFLNLGSGTGYLNTIVGLIIGPHGLNHGIEYHEDVVQYAQDRLERFKRQSFAIDKFDFADPVFIHGDCVKLNPNARYDRVYLGAACTPELETFMKKLVKPAGGVLVMPLDCFLLRYIRITEVEWRIEKLMQVSFTLMIREPRGNDDDTKMIDMPIAQPKSLKELCRIKIRQHIRDKTNLENPKLLNSDNIEARRMRKARAERKLMLKQARDFRRRYQSACPFVKDNNDHTHRSSSGSGGDSSHKTTCRRWPCRELNDLAPKNNDDNHRIMTRSARKRFELSRLFNRFRTSPTTSNNSVSGQLRGRDNYHNQNDSASSDSSQASSRNNRSSGNHSGPVTRSEACARTRPFVSRSNRQQSNLREQAPSPARLGEPYRVTRSAFPASRRADIRRIIDSSYCPVGFMSSPSTASTHSDSSSSSSSSSSSTMRQDEEEAIGRHRPSELPDFPSLLRIRRRALSDLASRALLSSIFEPIPNDDIDDDSDYEEESDGEQDSFDDDFNDPDLSGLESIEDNEEEVTTTSDESSVSDEDDDDDDDDDDDEFDGDDEGNGDGNPSSSKATRAAVVTAAMPTIASTNRYRHCHMQQLGDRKRKRHSSSSSCSEASNPSSPRRRGHRGPLPAAAVSTQCCTDQRADERQTGNSRQARRRCGCPQAVTKTPTPNDNIAAGAGGASSSSSSTHGADQLVRNASEARSNHRGRQQKPAAVKISGPPPHSMETSPRWTRLRSLISGKAKTADVRPARLASSSSGSSQSAACLHDSNSSDSGDMFATVEEEEEEASSPSSTKQRQSDRSAPDPTSRQASEPEGVPTRCSYRHRHHCRSHGHALRRRHHHHHEHEHHHHHHRRRHHHHHHHHRYCCGKCSRHRVTASSSNQQSESAEIECLSSSSSSSSAAAVAVVAAAPAAANATGPCCSCSASTCQNCRASGSFKNSNESTYRRQQQQERKSRQKKKNQRRVRSENECQRYHNHMSAYISLLPVPQVLKNYLNFDRAGGNI